MGWEGCVPSTPVGEVGMAFTYDVSTNIGKVRMLIGDKDDSHPIFQDEEVVQRTARASQIAPIRGNSAGRSAAGRSGKPALLRLEIHRERRKALRVRRPADRTSSDA